MMNKLFALLACFVFPLSSASVLTITKTPYEVLLCSVDFALAVGTDTVTLAAVSSVNVQSKADSSSIIVAASPVPAFAPSTKKVVFAVTGGSSGQGHLVSVKVVDVTTGEQFEGQITLNLK